MAEIKQALIRVEEPNFQKEVIYERLNDLPRHIRPLSSQVAGHDLAVFYDHEKKRVTKPIFDIRGIREERFYSLLFQNRYDRDPKLVKLRSFIPKYFETTTVNNVQFVELSDLTVDTVNPSLMDVKLGHTTYDRDATPDKVSREESRDQLNKVLGYKVLAVKKWIDDENRYEERDRELCRNCSFQVEKEVILFYLKQSDESKTKELINSVMNELNKIYDWFTQDNVDLFEFIGSSLFFIYTWKNNKLDLRIKMIDFAHVYPLEGSAINKKPDKLDHNYLDGLTRFIAKIEEIKNDLITSE